MNRRIIRTEWWSNGKTTTDNLINIMIEQVDNCRNSSSKSGIIFGICISGIRDGKISAIGIPLTRFLSGPSTLMTMMMKQRRCVLDAVLKRSVDDDNDDEADEFCS